MDRVNVQAQTAPDLERMIEPLAGYICAADRPRAALMSALAALFHEVALTHRAAHVHLRTLSENHQS